MSVKRNKLGILFLTMVTSASQFLVYRYIYQKLGKEAMGIWSIVVASTSLGLISNFGLGVGLTKFVAEYSTQSDRSLVYKYAATANAVNLLFSFPIIFILYFPLHYFAAGVLTPPQMVQFAEMLPWCLLAMFVNNIASTYCCLLDGFQSFFSRSVIQSIGYILFCISAIVLSSFFGLRGVSWALCFQSFFILVASAKAAFNKGFISRVFPLYLHVDVFKNLVSYGLKFQLISLLVFLFDPIVKFFLTRFYTLSATATYELVNKVILQFRGIVVNLNQVITPTVASLGKEEEVNLYMSDSFKSNYFLAVNASIFSIFCLPVACYFFTGAIDTLYFIVYIILSAGWLVNMISAPFYYSFLGINKMRYLIIQHCFNAFVPILFFMLFRSNLPLKVAFVTPALAVFLGGAYLIYIGIKYYRLSEALQVIVKQRFLYIYVALIATLLLDQVLFAGNYFLVIIPLVLVVWLYNLYSSPLVRLVLPKFVPNKA